MPLDRQNEAVTPIDFGASGIIIPMIDGYFVRKKMRRHAAGHDALTQQRIHRASMRVLIDDNNFDHLRMPLLADTYDVPDDWYVMERIDVRYPIWLGDPDSLLELPDEIDVDELSNELARWWLQMWNMGFAPWDFELYYQPRTQRVMIIDVDKFGFRRTTLNPAAGAPNTDQDPVEMPVPLPLNLFFENPCFPRDFVERMRRFDSLLSLGILANQRLQ